LNITVCIKRVPDTEARIRVADGGTGIESDGVKYVLNPYDEFAVEAALQLVEAAETGEVTLLSFGGDSVKETLRSGLAMGAHKAVLLKGEPSMDGLATAKVLAAEIAGHDAQLVLFGVKAIDGDQQQVGPMVAELLNRPCATSVASLELAGGLAVCRRSVEGGTEIVEVDLPAVATVTKGSYQPRYASLKGIMAAKRKPLEERDAPALESDLVLLGMVPPAERPEGRIVGEGPEAVAELVRLLREEAQVI